MRLRNLTLLTGLFLLTLPVMADTTYTYTGNPFDSVQSPYTTSDFVRGSITLAEPLGPNAGFDYRPLLWSSPTLPFLSISFSDGVQTLSSSSPNFVPSHILVNTDASGDITYWSISLGDGVDGADIQTLNDEFTQEDYDVSAAGAIAHVIDPGVWTLTNASAVPEPSTLALLGTSALGIVSAVRRRFAQP